jgi:hypothetical protein
MTVRCRFRSHSNNILANNYVPGPSLGTRHNIRLDVGRTQASYIARRANPLVLTEIICRESHTRERGRQRGGNRTHRDIIRVLFYRFRSSTETQIRRYRCDYFYYYYYYYYYCFSVFAVSFGRVRLQRAYLHTCMRVCKLYSARFYYPVTFYARIKTSVNIFRSLCIMCIMYSRFVHVYCIRTRSVTDVTVVIIIVGRCSRACARQNRVLYITCA